jgi:homoserine acetyltransferase
VVPAAIRVSTLLVAAEGDTLVPVEQMEALARELGGVRRLLRLRTRHGHDAFLCEPVAMGRIIRTALAGAPVS